MAEGYISKIIEAAKPFSTTLDMKDISYNFNDYTTNGNFLCGNTNSYTNAPTGVADNGYLLVFAPFTDRTIQVWIGTYVGKIQVRYRHNSTWGSWATIWQN